MRGKMVMADQALDDGLADFEAWDRDQASKKRGPFYEAINRARANEFGGNSEEFIDSCEEQLIAKGFLSPRQVEVLEEIALRDDEDYEGYSNDPEWYKS